MFASALYIFVTDVCVYMQVLNGLSLWRLYQHVNGTSAKHAWAWKMKIKKNPGAWRDCRYSDSSTETPGTLCCHRLFIVIPMHRRTFNPARYRFRRSREHSWCFCPEFLCCVFSVSIQTLWTTLPPQVKNQSALFYHHHHHHHNNNDDDYYYYCCCCFNFFFVGHRRNCFDHFNALGHSSRRRVTRRLLRGHLKNPSEPNVWWILPWILSNIECGFVQKCKSQCNSNIKMKLWKHLFVHEAVSALFLRCQT